MVTIWDLVAACRRRWPILLAGLLVACGSLWTVVREPGVYWAQTDLILLAPTSSRFPNSLNTSSESVIMMAGIVERRVDLGEDLEATSSANVTLVDDGVRNGLLVRVPNLGGQWATNFSQPVLDVQAVAATPQVVERRMEAAQALIINTLDQLQDEAGVDAFNRITIQPSPASLEINYSHGYRVRASAIALALCLSATLSCVVVVDSRQRRRRPAGGGAMMADKRPRPAKI